MAVKLATVGGTEYVLNPSFRVEGVPLARVLPGVRMDGQDDIETHPGLIRPQAREIAVTGHIYGETREVVRQEMDTLLAVLHDEEDLQLYLDEGDARYYRVRLISWPHVFVEGTAQCVAVIRLGFRALDPYAVGEALAASGGSGVYVVDNPGDVDAEPVYTLAVSGVVTGLQLALDTLGRTLELGDAEAGDTIVIDTGLNRRILRNDSLLVTPDWFRVLGFPLAPGSNVLIVSVATGNVADIALSVSGNARYF